MKKTYLILGSLALSSFFAHAQKSDSLYKKENLRKTEIELLYSQYNQNGNNSAVTGGIGTERLSVYGPSVRIKSIHRNRNIYSLKGGADFITSASTDNIDFVVSSASLHDTRGYANLGYARRSRKKDLTVSGGTGFSMESDYLSIPINAGIAYTEKNKMRSYSLDVLTYFDDLRWGRLNPEYLAPVRLIYPVELRYKDWYNTYLRQSYNIKTSMTQVIDKRNIIGLYPELSYQHGLLATPFHRVYFSDGSLRVENLPSERIKGLLGLKANNFVGGRTILKNQVDYYTDNFGITGFGIENETSVKITSKIVLSPFFRFYIQKGSRYFAPYKEHTINEVYYTSDYDLSSFTTYKGGLSFKYSPNKYLSKKFSFNDITIRYALFYRSNNLVSHIITCNINMAFTKTIKDKSE